MHKIKRVFLDSSVLIAASASSQGGSYYIVHLGIKKKIRIILTHLIIQEVIKNIQNKLSPKELLNFYKFLLKLNNPIKDNPTFKEVDYFCRYTNEKDAHVLAGAHKHQVDFLITLDKELLQNKKNFNFQILTPKEFLLK